MAVDAVFVSDVHLSENEPQITSNFLHFLHYCSSQTKALYILGDLFEVWIGDDEPSALHDKVASAFKKLTENGMQCYFIHGNRDFLIGQQFSQKSGLILLPQETVLTSQGKRIVILHGDTLCIDDKGYQRLRKFFHCALIQRGFLALPLNWRLLIAKKMRQKSQDVNTQKQAIYLDVNENEVRRVISRHDASIMIHGHIHRAAVYHDETVTKPFTRVVLGAWDQNADIAFMKNGDVTLQPLNLFLESDHAQENGSD